MFKIVQKFATAPPTGLYSHVAPLKWYYLVFTICSKTLP